MAFTNWKLTLLPLLLAPLAQLAAAQNATVPAATTLVTSATVASSPTPAPAPAGDCVGTCTVFPYTCGLRATCEVFNPLTPASNFGKQFCVCQAGYRATGVSPTDTTQQYHLTWKNVNGDQTHRVFVKPGQDC